MKFGEHASELADKAAAIELGTEPFGTATTNVVEPEPEAADPTFAFLQAWGELESYARDAGPGLGLRDPRPVPVIRELAKRKIVPEAAADLADELRSVRNRVAHGSVRLESTDAADLASAVRSITTTLARGLELLYSSPK